MRQVFVSTAFLLNEEISFHFHVLIQQSSNKALRRLRQINYIATFVEGMTASIERFSRNTYFNTLANEEAVSTSSLI